MNNVGPASTKKRARSEESAVLTRHDVEPPAAAAAAAITPSVDAHTVAERGLATMLCDSTKASFVQQAGQTETSMDGPLRSSTASRSSERNTPTWSASNQLTPLLKSEGTLNPYERPVIDIVTGEAEVTAKRWRQLAGGS